MGKKGKKEKKDIRPTLTLKKKLCYSNQTNFFKGLIEETPTVSWRVLKPHVLITVAIRFLSVH